MTGPLKQRNAFNVHGERNGAGPTFMEHIDTAEGQAEVQALRERIEARLPKERALACQRLERIEAQL